MKQYTWTLFILFVVSSHALFSMREQEQKNLNDKFSQAVLKMEGMPWELQNLKKMIQQGVDAHTINIAMCNVLQANWSPQALPVLLSFFIEQSSDINASISQDQNISPLVCIIKAHKLSPEAKKNTLELCLKKGADVTTIFPLTPQELFYFGVEKDSLSLTELINITKNKNINFPDPINSDYLTTFNTGLELFLNDPAKFEPIKVGDDILTVDFFKEHMKNAVKSKNYNSKRIAQYEKYQKQKALEKAKDNEFTDVLIFTGE